MTRPVDAATAAYAEQIGCPDFMPDDGCCHRFGRTRIGTHKLPCCCRTDALGLAAVAAALEVAE